MRGDPKYHEVTPSSASAKLMSTRSKASTGKPATSSPVGSKRGLKAQDKVSKKAEKKVTSPEEHKKPSASTAKPVAKPKQAAKTTGKRKAKDNPEDLAKK